MIPYWKRLLLAPVFIVCSSENTPDIYSEIQRENISVRRENERVTAAVNLALSVKVQKKLDSVCDATERDSIKFTVCKPPQPTDK